MWTLPIVLPTVMLHGTDDQKRRWIRPTMLGELTWCQLFSEPGAGSDLASLTTRAERVDGGWLVTGQKVWTSSANQAGHGFALVRTDASAPKHKGISCMAIDMHAPGVTVRPLREICEAAGFNEVFLDEVYVPDADVVGDVNRGWAVARTTLDFERVSLGEQGWTVGMQWQEIEHRVEELESGGAALVDVGRIVAEGIAARALSLRVAARAVAGAEPGVEGSVTKLAIALQAQAVADLGLRLLGDRGVFADEESAVLADFFLQARLSTIAGGTSEILRNVIAERALGLPRDPLPQDRGGEAGR